MPRVGAEHASYISSVAGSAACNQPLGCEHAISSALDRHWKVGTDAVILL